MSETNYAVELTDFSRYYQMGDEQIKALDHINFTVRKGEYVAIEGPSGSGKSTLMNLIGLLDNKATGQYRLDGIDVSSLNDNQQAAIRNQKIGFVFQNFNLLNKMTALENVQVPLLYKGMDEKEAEKTASFYLDKVHLKDRQNHLPSQMSGGQQQRVAIARALVCQPEIILADEPTGALDRKTGFEIMDILSQLNKDGQTIIVITHDHQVALKAKRIVHIIDGQLQNEEAVI